MSAVLIDAIKRIQAEQLTKSKAHSGQLTNWSQWSRR